MSPSTLLSWLAYSLYQDWRELDWKSRPVLLSRWSPLEEARLHDSPGAGASTALVMEEA